MSSRAAAPLAQCEPRLIGVSQLGSWPIQTPLATSAVTVQPTAQWVQTLFFVASCAPGVGGGPAFALGTPLSGKAPRAARLPGATPDRRQKPRRARPRSALPPKGAGEERRG